MCILTLINQHDKLSSSILEQLKSDKVMIKQLAEDMVECATHIQGHGYPAFIQSRDKFFAVLDEMVDQYSTLIKYHV